MTKKTLGTLVTLAALGATAWTTLGPGPAAAVPPAHAAVWDVVDVESEAPARRGLDPRTLDPSAYAALELDHPRMRARLASAPSEGSGDSITIDLPSPTGELRTFAVTTTELLEPELAAAFPLITAYMGTATDGSGDRIRFVNTPSGFHAQIASTDGWWYVEPQTLGDTSRYVSYLKSDLRSRAEWTEDPAIEELMAEARAAELATIDVAAAPGGELAARSNGTQIRTYRLAVAADSTYVSQNGGTVPLAMDAIVDAVSQLNGIYEPELAIRFTLVANNDLLVFTNDGGACDPTGAGPNCDPFTTNNGDNLDANQLLVDSVIGNSAYDIGHVFTGTNCGLAAGGVVGRTGQKAQGCSGLAPATGDPFVVDYVAHEIGHQFGAEHTFNGCSGLNGNRVGTSAFEPGSASTILGYAGICFEDDVQLPADSSAATGASDPYFHSHTFDQIVTYTTDPSSPGNLGAANSGNAIPTAVAGAHGTIPDSTPFRLTGRSSDGDPADVLTHRWEQRDLGAQRGLADPEITAGPLFRSRVATTEPTRHFPTLSAIADGNTNLDGPCTDPPGDAIDRQCWSEYVPTAARELNFRMTVLDGNGGVDSDNTVIDVVDTADPFVVITPNGGGSRPGGDSLAVAWEVAGTTAPPISADIVNIRLSLDDGLTYPWILADGTPNDGNEIVTLPGVAADTTARIMVESTNDYCGVHFFDVSDASFTVSMGGTPEPTPVEPECTPPPVAFESLTPARFVDTRPTGDTFDDQFQAQGKRIPDSTYTVDIAGRGLVPSDALAVVMNLTAIAAEEIGFVTVHPCVEQLPIASSLNHTPGVNIANEIVAPLSDDGEICIYTDAMTHIAVDVMGYVPASSTVVPVTPARFLDTRPAGSTFDGNAELGQKVEAFNDVLLTVADRGAVPPDAVSVIANVTAVAAEENGFVTVDPCADDPPDASSLNYVPGVNRANEIVASIDDEGRICLFTSARTHLLVDIVGYVRADTDVSPTAPSRILDSRQSSVANTVDGQSLGMGKFPAGTEYRLRVAGRGGVNPNATVAVLNVTAAGAEGVGFITAHPCSTPRPLASSLNYVSGVNGATEIIARLSDDGDLCLYTSERTNILVDVVGYDV